MKKVFFGLFAVAFIAGSFFLFRSVWASAYEWMAFLGTSPGCCHAYVTTTVSWQVGTRSAWNELRALYYGTSSGSGIMPTQWVEYTDGTYPCRKQGVINGFGPVDSCRVTVPNLGNASGSTYLWFRATTNYGGCGSWTAEPKLNCGDWMSAGTLYYPAF